MAKLDYYVVSGELLRTIRNYLGEKDGYRPTKFYGNLVER